MNPFSSISIVVIPEKSIFSNKYLEKLNKFANISECFQSYRKISIYYKSREISDEINYLLEEFTKKLKMPAIQKDSGNAARILEKFAENRCHLRKIQDRKALLDWTKIEEELKSQRKTLRFLIKISMEN